MTDKPMPLTAEEITELAVGQWTYKVEGPHREEINTFVHRLAENLRAERAARAAAERERDDIRDRYTEGALRGMLAAKQAECDGLADRMLGMKADIRVITAEREAAERNIDTISVACGFPIVEDREQVTGTICKKIARLARENADLRAVVERLPKTADGVPVLQGDTVYTEWHLRGIVSGVVCIDTRNDDQPADVWVEAACDRCGIDDCYSTRAAAEAARRAPDTGERGGG